MEFEVHYTRIIEAENFFEAVEIAKDTIEDLEEVITVCPAMQDDMIDML